MIALLIGRLLIASLLFSTASGGVAMSLLAPVDKAGTFDQSLEIGGQTRTYRVHIPSVAPPPNGLPVLIALHGGGGNAGVMEAKSGLSQLADQDGFIVVYPNGTGRTSKLLTWDAHNCCGYAYENKIDDVGFISALIDQLIANFDVDPTRISVTGHSNGAMMTYRLGCELSDKIAAIAVVAGALNTDSCKPSRPLPVLMIHGADDDHVPLNGASYSSARSPSQRDRVDQPLSHAVDTWVEIDQCNPVPTTKTDLTMTVSVYADCAAGTEIERVVLANWGHGWPRVDQGAPLDASPLIWDFVSRFSNQAASA